MTRPRLQLLVLGALVLAGGLLVYRQWPASDVTAGSTAPGTTGAPAAGAESAVGDIRLELLETRGEAECEEGCLSVPGIYETVRRAEWIKVRALDRDGQPFTLETAGLLAVCIQHEVDHLKGKVFVEYLSRLKQTRIRAKLQKQNRRATAAA